VGVSLAPSLLPEELFAAAGIGIRESATAVTDNSSAFVPHLFE
jgi:hypothetical protein